jgi:hypothetical protein
MQQPGVDTLIVKGDKHMSAGWVWAIWAAAMIVWSAFALTYDLGANEMWVFVAIAVLLSIGADYTARRIDEPSPP